MLAQKLPEVPGSKCGSRPTSTTLRAPRARAQRQARDALAEQDAARHDSQGHQREPDRTAAPVEPAPERHQTQAGRHPAGRQPDQHARHRRPGVPEHRADDQRRGDELTAVDQRHPRVGQQQVARRHRHAGDRPVEEPPADAQQAQHQGDMRHRGDHPRRDHLGQLALERAGQKRVPDQRLHGRAVAARRDSRPVLAAGRLGRVTRGAFLDGQDHGLGQQQAEQPDRQAEQPRRVEIRLQQRATGQPQVEHAAQQPEPRPDEQPDVPGPRHAAGASHGHQGPRHQGEQEQQVEVPHAPESAELEEQRQAGQHRQEQPGFPAEPQGGIERPIHGSLVRSISPTRRGGVRQRSGTAR